MSDPMIERTLPDVLREAGGLPSPTAAGREVLRLLRTEGASPDDLARALARDPGLSTQLLKLANSAAFRIGAPTTSVQQACGVLGWRSVALLSFGISVVASLRKGAGFPYEDLWHRSLLRATAARSIARVAGSRCSDDAFLCGLLGRLGQVALARCLPREYSRAITASGGAWPDAGLERRLLGFDHHEIGATLLSTWGAPPLVARGVALQGGSIDGPADLPAPARELACVLSAAAGCERLLTGDARAEAALTASAGRLGLGPTRIEPLLAQLRQQVAEVAEALSIDVPRAIAPAPRSETTEREAQLDPLTGLASRARFETLLAEQIDKRRRRSTPDLLGLLLFEVDDFEWVSDKHGRPVGDEVLQMIARVARAVSRDSDCVARIGGAELAVLMPRTSFDGLASLGERIRIEVERARVAVGDEPLSVTVSLGGAAIARFERDEDAGALRELVRRCLSRAKQEGRNRCVFHPGADLPAI